ncbi:hypothetical protein CRUP_002296, partial [Coryphaenoides rupestris]
TGYGLLALLKSGRLEEAAAPFNWLNSQRRRGGGYGSTQPTLVVLQALTEYLALKPPGKDVSLQVQLKLPGRIDLTYHFDARSAYVPRSTKGTRTQRRQKVVLDVSLPTGFTPENSDLE